MKVFIGKPDDLLNRSNKECKEYDVLDKMKIVYERVDHAPLYTMADYQDVEKSMKEGKVFKNLFLCNRQQTKFYLLFLPGDKKFKTKEISNQINSARLSFATEDKMQELLHVTMGACSPLCLINDVEQKVTFLIDQDFLKEKYILIHPLVNTTTLKLKCEDLLKVIEQGARHTIQYVALKGE